MYNNNTPPMNPRISFSNDFVESSRSLSATRAATADPPSAAASSDFEFSTSNYSMISADELFSKGRLLPLKESCTHKTTTLRDELLQSEDDADAFSLRPPKNPARWRGFLGLRKSHIGSKNKSSSEKTTPFHHDDKNSQDYVEG